jgi:hypothetical protein
MHSAFLAEDGGVLYYEKARIQLRGSVGMRPAMVAAVEVEKRRNYW